MSADANAAAVLPRPVGDPFHVHIPQPCSTGSSTDPEREAKLDRIEAVTTPTPAIVSRAAGSVQDGVLGVGTLFAWRKVPRVRAARQC